jgi:hypothetical protein
MPRAVILRRCRRTIRPANHWARVEELIKEGAGYTCFHAPDSLTEESWSDVSRLDPSRETIVFTFLAQAFTSPDDPFTGMGVFGRLSVFSRFDGTGIANKAVRRSLDQVEIHEASLLTEWPLIFLDR